jgi:hypothetical protein
VSIFTYVPQGVLEFRKLAEIKVEEFKGKSQEDISDDKNRDGKRWF